MGKPYFKYVLRQFILFCLVISWPFLKASPQEYFQQEVNYKINVTLDDRKHELNGFESVGYINNSPDTLRFLYFHLWPNAYSDNNTELARQVFNLKGKGKLFNDPDLRGYIDSLDFKADDHSLIWSLKPGSPDICKIILNRPVKPGDTVNISTPFHIKIPKGVTSLFGHTGESYNISQWYPKPAVYDRSGWHQMPYLDQGEFFSEFGNFDVSITLPANYLVAATGNLQNEQEKEDFKTLRYTGNSIHDFAWFADKRFRVMKGKVKLPDSGREITTWAMFTDQEAPLWKDAISYINNAIWYYSLWIGDYPYDNFTAVQSTLSAGLGMEYPGLTVIGHTDDPYMLDKIISHEICHSWFYSALGSDERRFPFLDESITVAYESRYLDKKYPGKRLWEVYFKNRRLAKVFHIDKMPVQRLAELEWLTIARRNLEQPVNLAAPDYSQENYSILIYNKTAHGFNYLRAYLGDSLFDSIMHDYYRTWKFRHPGPEDLRAVFGYHTTKDLSWFFDDFLGTTRRLDYKMVRLKNRQILIKNKGELKAPLLIAGVKGDSICSEKWEDGFEGEKWISPVSDNYTEIKIDPGHKMPELFRLNNNIRESGLFRRVDPFHPRFLFTVEESDKQSVIYTPAVSWNSENDFMAGVVLHNGILIPKPVEYLLIPFYTFRDPGLAGYGKVSLNITPYDNIIRVATFSLEGEQFGAPGDQNYRKAKIGLDLSFRSGKMINAVRQKVFGHYISVSDLHQIQFLTQAKMRSFLYFGYLVERTGIINPFNMLISVESGKSFQKVSMGLNYKYSYYGINNGLEIRTFAGAMLQNDSPYPFHAFSPGGRSGHELYFFQGLFPDRFGDFPETFWSRQMTLDEGGLVTPVNSNLGYSHWICSITLTSTLPGKASRIPVKPFVNLLLNDHGAGTTYKSPLFFEAGFKAGMWNFFEIYFPLLISENIESIAGTLKDRIRFVFKLEIFNPLRL